MTRRCFVILAALLAPGAALAQDSLARTISTLPPRLRIRVETAGGERFYGRYLTLAGNTLALSSPIFGGYRRVTLDTVTRVWTQQGTHSRQFGLIGIPIGGVVMGFGLYQLCRALAEGPQTCGAPEALTGAVAGGVAGGLLGVAIGALVPRWKPVYP